MDNNKKFSFKDKKIQNYRIEYKIGPAIYRAKEDFTNRTVQIKIIPKSDDYQVEKLIDLANTLAAVGSESIPQFYTMIEDEDFYYMALELIEGKSLQEWLDEGREFTLEEIFNIIISIADGLGKGHKIGVIHQNLYPKTIVIKENNIVKLINYGLNLKVGKTGFDLDDVVKTKYKQGSELKVDEEAFFYWSPELYFNEPLDSRADIYSLGVIFYNLVTKTYPLGSATGIGYLNKLESEQPISAKSINSRVPEEVDQILTKMLQPKKQDRYQTASELLDALKEYMKKRGNDIRFQEKEYVAKAFIAMPFAENFDPVFEVIEAACEENSVKAIRVDNLVDIDNIWYAILREIDDSEFVIADFSGDKYEDVPNCNVVTEAAHARALGKPIILMSQHPEHMFFDWRTQHAIKYNLATDNWKPVQKSLQRKIKGCLEYLKKMKDET